ncbi:MAG: 5'-nucleotidase SurE [Candidatus Heimdallarchaeota archaeon LC_3]|nr:MAG: 5'-nucleotidase SurE [Candidatus Heimdallarchaeota archaeon LC_3]
MQKTILLTNDDGIQSPGLKALKIELKTDYDVKIVASYTAQSAQGVSHSHGDRWVKYEKFGDGIAVHGSPATCVSVALRELGIKPDLVVSGINFGEKLGLNIFILEQLVQLGNLQCRDIYLWQLHWNYLQIYTMSSMNLLTLAMLPILLKKL